VEERREANQAIVEA
jgi:hypothetical protein